MESGSKVFHSSFEGAWRPMSRHAALGMVAFFLSLTLLSGCFRDPNVRNINIWRAARGIAPRARTGKLPFSFQRFEN